MTTTALSNARAFEQLTHWKNNLSMDLLADVDYSRGFSFEDGDVAYVDCDCADEDFLPGRWTYENDDGKFQFELCAKIVRGEARLQFSIEMIERA